MCLESFLYALDSTDHGKLPIKHHLPSSHFSNDIHAAKSLEEGNTKEEMTSDLFFQTLGATTSNAPGFPMPG